MSQVKKNLLKQLTLQSMKDMVRVLPSDTRPKSITKWKINDYRKFCDKCKLITETGIQTQITNEEAKKSSSKRTKVATEDTVPVTKKQKVEFKKGDKVIVVDTPEPMFAIVDNVLEYGVIITTVASEKGHRYELESGRFMQVVIPIWDVKQIKEYPILRRSIELYDPERVSSFIIEQSL